jgi:site-specific DNA recombinase
VPLGYEVCDRQLVINEAEATTVRHIFTRYCEFGSVRLLKEELDRLGVRSKIRVSKAGVESGGRAFSRGALYTLLRQCDDTERLLGMTEARGLAGEDQIGPDGELEATAEAVVPIENLNSDVLMMEPAEDRYRSDATDLLLPPEFRSIFTQ